MLRGVLPFAAENDIVESFLIFVKCSKMILEQINAVRALAKSGGFCYTVSSLLGCGNAREGEEMEQTNKGLSGNQLKLIAMLAMTVDHFTSVIWPDYPRDWWILLLHIIGRMAAPIFWFMVAEGYHYTRDLKKYAGRLLLFAVIGHFAYNFAFGIPFVPLKTGVFNQTSVMWPLFLGVVGLYTVERPELKQWQKDACRGRPYASRLPGRLGAASAVLAILEIGQNRGDLPPPDDAHDALGRDVRADRYALFIDPVYGMTPGFQLFAGLTIPLLKRLQRQSFHAARAWNGMVEVCLFFYLPALEIPRTSFSAALSRIYVRRQRLRVMVGGRVRQHERPHGNGGSAHTDPVCYGDRVPRQTETPLSWELPFQNATCMNSATQQRITASGT